MSFLTWIVLASKTRHGGWMEACCNAGGRVGGNVLVADHAVVSLGP